MRADALILNVTLKHRQSGVICAKAIERYPLKTLGGSSASLMRVVTSAALAFENHLIDNLQHDAKSIDMQDFVVVALAVASAPDKKPVRYAVEARYPAGHPDWSDWVEATSRDDAELQARFAVAKAETGHRNDVTVRQFIHSVAEAMTDVHIDAVQPEPVTKGEAIAMIRRFVTASDALLTSFGAETPTAQYREIGILGDLVAEARLAIAAINEIAETANTDNKNNQAS
jgi:hypothetical protein